eukprot:evm.model.NODE_17513_length_31895_cov_24.001411.11
MGWRRFLKEDAERKVDWERVQILENDKMRREAEALAKMAAERKEARLLERQKEQDSKLLKRRPPKKTLTGTVGIPNTVSRGPAVVHIPTSLKHRITAKIIADDEKEEEAEENEAAARKLAAASAAASWAAAVAAGSSGSGVMPVRRESKRSRSNGSTTME